MLVSELGREFQDHLEGSGISLGYDARIQVLTSATGPATKTGVAARCMLCSYGAAVSGLYRTKTLNRNLRWIHALGSVTLCGFDGKSIDLIVNTFQACILMLFNTSASLSMQDIVDGTGMNAELVTKHITPLVFGKYRILDKSPTSAGTSLPTDVYTFNAAFADKARKVRIPMVLQGRNREADKMRASNVAKMTEERKFAMEAAIVKTMKTNKMMEHNALVSAVSQALLSRFKPDPRDLKRTVDISSTEIISSAKRITKCVHLCCVNCY